MNFIKWMVSCLLLFSINALASEEYCNGVLNARLSNSFVDGEPLSDLFVYNGVNEIKMEMPFSVAGIKCNNLGDNILHVSLSADLPRGRSADYYFRKKTADAITYIGGIIYQATTTGGGYRATGIYKIEKGDDTEIVRTVDGEDKVLLNAIQSAPYLKSNNSIGELYEKGANIEIDLLSRSSNEKICGDNETTIFYCKTRKNKILNLCYEPEVGYISYYFGNKNKIDIKLSDYEYSMGVFTFKNKGTNYIVSPSDNKIKVESKSQIITELQCFN
ncbi:hypothetical protein FT670_19870 [Aeromonas jandaei]|nr:hypothetical protein FT670_19870 [Aeromonas jandaei]